MNVSVATTRHRLFALACRFCPGCLVARRFPHRRETRLFAAVMRICPGCPESRALPTSGLAEGGCCVPAPEPPAGKSSSGGCGCG